MKGGSYFILKDDTRKTSKVKLTIWLFVLTSVENFWKYDSES